MGTFWPKSIRTGWCVCSTDGLTALYLLCKHQSLTHIRNNLQTSLFQHASINDQIETLPEKTQSDSCSNLASLWLVCPFSTAWAYVSSAQGNSPHTSSLWAHEAVILSNPWCISCIATRDVNKPVGCGAEGTSDFVLLVKITQTLHRRLQANEVLGKGVMWELWYFFTTDHRT